MADIWIEMDCWWFIVSQYHREQYLDGNSEGTTRLLDGVGVWNRFCYFLRVHGFERALNHNDHHSEDLQGVDSNTSMNGGKRWLLVLIVIAESVA